MRAAVTYLDQTARVWQDGVAVADDGGVRLTVDAPTSGLPRLDGVVTGGFTDAHVHLQLVDLSPLGAGVLGRVVDLGGNPSVLANVHNSSAVRRKPADRAETEQIRRTSEELCAPKKVRVDFAGAFLTPPGGYPSDRSWAPPGSVREIADTDAAASAVAEMKLAGAAVIKVASNTTAGPVFTDGMFRAIVTLAASHDLSVVAHAEGPGEAQRVSRLGARMLAHAPFTELLTDDELRAMRGSVPWISTLAIHDGEAYDIAVDNVRRFRALGGTVRYGTDMGNGPTPVGLNAREIAALREAGIDGADLLRALAPVDPLDPASRLLFFPGATPETADPLATRPLTAADLKAL